MLKTKDFSLDLALLYLTDERLDYAQMEPKIIEIIQSIQRTKHYRQVRSRFYAFEPKGSHRYGKKADRANPLADVSQEHMLFQVLGMLVQEFGAFIAGQIF